MTTRRSDIVFGGWAFLAAAAIILILAVVFSNPMQGMTP